MLQLFIGRPVLASVISIIIVFLGALALSQIPIAQFPEIVPPSVIVTAKYQGANAEVCTKAVATPLERAINGVPGMTYMQTVTSNTGATIIQVFFKVGVSPDMASVNVQNRVSTVIEELPEEVVKAGVTVEKEVNSLLMYINVMSDDVTADEKFVYNFTDINILQELKRVEGVGFAEILGAKDYAMRIWLKPDKMAAYNISAKEVIAAIRSQNIEAAPGNIGESSDKVSQDLLYVLHYTGKYKTPEEYRNIIIKTGPDGVSKLKIKDIAEVEFGALAYNLVSKTDGRPSASILLKQRPESNAQQIIQNVKEKMQYLQATIFPVGMKYNINYDISSFLNASIHEIVRTLIEAFILVFIVVFVFLQDWRSVLICLISIPVSLIGAIFFMYAMGFSINLLTLFALILAIGIVVDDAIVVVEAVHAKMMQGRNAKDAAISSLQEIAYAVIAITLVMIAIFVPTIFMTGPSGVFYKQFSLTLVSAIVLSGLNALTLIPSLCALILRPHKVSKPKRWSIHTFFQRLESYYFWVENQYVGIVRRLVRKRFWIIMGVIITIVLSYLMNAIIATAFVPVEDQGVIYANVTTPPGSTVERTQKVMDKLQQVTTDIPVIESVSTLAGYSLVSESTGPSYGMALINLKKWHERKVSVQEVMNVLSEKLRGISDADIQLLEPPTVPGFGNTSGFELRLLDKRGDNDYNYTEEVTRNVVEKLSENPKIMNVFSQFNVSFPQFLLHIDNDMATNQGVDLGEALFQLQTLLGSYYASNFIRFGQLYKVMLQALPEYRNQPSDIMRMYVKNKEGAMVPYSNFARLEQVYGPQQLTRYNMYTSSMITGEPTKGYSSGQVIKETEHILDSVLPRGFAYEWSGITKEEIESGNQFVIIFLISIVFVYLILSAQYESFLLPIAVLCILPVGYLGALSLLYFTGLSVNIYTQVAVIMLMGLLGKNAILIIEFALDRCRKGVDAVQAVVEGARMRLRPILMTSFAFIFGLIPLCLATGAGAQGNKSIGIAAAGGMLFGTLIGLILTPGLFYIFVAAKYRKS